MARMTAAKALAVLMSHVPIRGREWLAARLFTRGRTSHEWWTVNIGRDLRLRLPASSRQTWTAAFTGRYDEHQIALLATHLRPGTVALDIGASLGLYTVQLAEQARAIGAKVVAIEPIHSNAEIVSDNIARNNLSAYASVLECALGLETGYVTMMVERGGAGNATVCTGVAPQAMVVHASEGSLGPDMTIAVKPLDDLRFDATVSIVKIDVEGFEMDVLGGAERFIARHRPVIFAEFSEPWMRSRGRSPDGPLEWAADHDYVVHRVAITSSGRILKKTKLQVTEIKSSYERGEAELLLVPR